LVHRTRAYRLIQVVLAIPALALMAASLYPVFALARAQSTRAGAPRSAVIPEHVPTVVEKMTSRPPIPLAAVARFVTWDYVVGESETDAIRAAGIKTIYYTDPNLQYVDDPGGSPWISGPRYKGCDGQDAVMTYSTAKLTGFFMAVGDPAYAAMVRATLAPLASHYDAFFYDDALAGAMTYNGPVADPPCATWVKFRYTNPATQALADARALLSTAYAGMKVFQNSLSLAPNDARPWRAAQAANLLPNVIGGVDELCFAGDTTIPWRTRASIAAGAPPSPPTWIRSLTTGSSGAWPRAGPPETVRQAGTSGCTCMPPICSAMTAGPCCRGPGRRHMACRCTLRPNWCRCSRSIRPARTPAGLPPAIWRAAPSVHAPRW
jgi:hypothetical protein